MPQALCWLAARLAGLAGVIESDDQDVLLLTGRETPLPAWVLRILGRAGVLRAGEEPCVETALSAAARHRLAMRGRVRAEYLRGAFAGFRSRALREAADFAVLKARATA
jgi:hypothetical protein